MARINIEECWWSDPRRELLGKCLGNSDLIETVAVRTWRLAQEFWSKGKLVPWNVFIALPGAEAVLKAGLARLHETIEPTSNVIPTPIQDLSNGAQHYFVYVRGSSEYLSWVQEQRLSAIEAGRKSAKRPRDAKGRLLPKVQRRSNKSPAQANAIQPSVSVSGFVSDSVSESFFYAQASENPATEVEISKEEKGSPRGESGVDTEGPSSTAMTYRAYKKAYEEKYKTEAPRSGRIMGQLKNLVSRLGSEDAPLVAEYYLTHHDSFYVRSGHSVGLLLRDAEKLRMEWATGRKITGIHAKQMESKSANTEVMKSYLAKKSGGME